MSKFSISPNKAKVISSLLLTSIISTLLFISLHFVMSASFKRFSNQYYKSCDNIATSYAYAVTNTLNQYKTLLTSFYLPDEFENQSAKEIQETLIKLIVFRNKISPDFFDVFFIDKDGIGYSQDGNSYDISDRDYYYNVFHKNYDFYISSPVLSKINDIPAIVISMPCKKSNGQIYGVLCASVYLSTFSEIINNSKLSELGQIIILDEEGRFIIHQDKEQLFHKFDPSITFGIKGKDSKTIANLEKCFLETVDVHGNPIKLYSQKIQNTNWTLGLKVPLLEENLIIEKNKKDVFRVMISVLLAIIILTCLEYWILNIFQKHQLIATIYDPLTNIWTREHFEYEATKWLKRFPHTKFMLIECDIRGFKFVNQNYGEISANKMLIRFSQMLNKIAEEYHGIIGRGFADRFYILCKINSVHKAMNTFKENLPVFNDEIKELDLPFFPKFGIAFLMPENRRRSVTIQGLIGQASFAKTTIKDNMMVQYAIYNSRLIKKVNEEQYIEQHMEQALKNREFFVMYQPKISLENDKIVGAEALVRWKSPELGLLSPDKFIPLFEKNGFITKLDFYVYEEVFNFLERIIGQGKSVVPISVNMSRNHSKPDKFMHQFLEIYKKYNIPASFIQIEILERSFMDNTTLQEITTNLHREGFSVAMDDFGSGESSLNMLTKIPVDVLKFDRNFLQSSTTETGEIDKKSAGFIEILIELSKQLNKETVFEGVETQQQRDFLKSIQCDQAQGFFYSRPLPEEEFISFIDSHN